MTEVKLSKAVLDKHARLDKALDRVDALLLRLGQQGLQRMTRSSLTELDAMAQLAHNGALSHIKRQLESLRTLVERYLERDPLFTMAAYQDTLSRVWLLSRKTRALRAEGTLIPDMLDVVGEARRSYTVLDEPLVVQPLGASGWVTDTGFVGVTVHLWSPSRPGEILEASNAKPTRYFGTDPRHLMRQPISDYVTVSTHDLSHGAYTMAHAKMSRDGRLSLHKDMRLTSAAYMGGRAYDRLAVKDWVGLLGRLRESAVHPVRSTASTPVFVEPTGYGEVVVDEKRARATAEVRDAAGATLDLEVPLRQENNFLIDNLERMLRRRKGLPPDALFGRAWLAEGRLKLFPWTAIYNQAVVLTEVRTRRVNEVHLTLESLTKVREA